MKENKRIVFDLDGCLCTQVESDYKDAKPIQAAIDLVNKLYSEGFLIIIHSARFMERNNHNPEKAHEEGFEFTKNQLNSWGVHYHELRLGKPRADVLIDDRSVFFEPDWNSIEKEIRRKLENN